MHKAFSENTMICSSYVDSEEAATLLQNPCSGKLERDNLSCSFLIQSAKEMEHLYLPENMLWTAM